MDATFQALAVTVVALLPGAMFTFAYERETGSFGVTASDRTVRFLAASAIFHALVAVFTYTAYRRYVIGGRLAGGHVHAWLVEVVAVVYVLAPAVVGVVLGRGQTSRSRLLGWTRWLSSGAPEPRAWDRVWRSRGATVVRLRLKSGTWLAGLWGVRDGRKAYASGYPEDGDLYLSVAFVVNPRSGRFSRSDAGELVIVPSSRGVLLRWEEVEYLEFLGA